MSSSLANHTLKSFLAGVAVNMIVIDAKLSSEKCSCNFARAANSTSPLRTHLSAPLIGFALIVVRKPTRTLLTVKKLSCADIYANQINMKFTYFSNGTVINVKQN